MLYKTKIYSNPFLPNQKDINLCKPYYCDVSIIRPVISNSKGYKVINKKNSVMGENCNPGTSDLAPLWYDLSDHYPIIGNFMFGKPSNSYLTNLKQFHDNNKELLTIENCEINPSDLKLRDTYKQAFIMEVKEVINIISQNNPRIDAFDMFNIYFWKKLYKSILFNYNWPTLMKGLRKTLGKTIYYDTQKFNRKEHPYWIFPREGDTNQLKNTDDLEEDVMGNQLFERKGGDSNESTSHTPSSVYNKIVNPITGRKVSITSRFGNQIIGNYLNMLLN
jgi:hypothetical protein